MLVSSTPWTLNVVNGAGHIHDRFGKPIGFFEAARDAEWVVEVFNTFGDHFGPHFFPKDLLDLEDACNI